ncbi:MAG: hypothetical protein ACC641_00330 [Acidiferrobacterales bacterium]
MGKSGQLFVGVTVLLLGVLTSYAAYAADLLPYEVNPIRVGTCAHQVRFKVKLLATNNENDTKSIRASYRIGIYPPRNKTPLTTFSVSEQKIGENFDFVVPSELLTCVSGVTIVVDDKKQFGESNKSNNMMTVKWKNHGDVFGSPCAAIRLDNCSK